MYFFPMRATCLLNLSDLIFTILNNICRGVEVMKLLQPSVTSFFFYVQIFSSVASSTRTPSIHVLPLMQETKFQTHTKLQKIFTFLDIRRSAKYSELNDSKHWQIIMFSSFFIVNSLNRNAMYSRKQ
jgi:hypothetical protein